MNFYARISELCKEKDISLAAVAREVGLSNSATTYWKRGSIPKGDTLQKLADYFGVSVDYLLGVPESVRAVGIVGAEVIDIGGSTLDGTRMRINAAVDKLNPSGQQKAVERVEELTEIPRYRAEARQEAEKPIPAPPEGKDTTPAEPPPESPGNGE